MAPSGKTTNPASTAASGAACQYAAGLGPITASRQLRGNELVPLADHVTILVHHRVPARHAPHSLGERAAVAHGPLGLDLLAEGVGDVLGRGLALHPVVPLGGVHLLSGRVEDRAVIALAVQEGADPAGEVPVDVLVRRVALQTGQVLRDAEPARPRTIAFLQGRVEARNAL